MEALKKLIAEYMPDDEREAIDRKNMLRALTVFDDALTRDNEIAHFSASSWIVNPERTHALMVWHNIYRHWSWTGGHADGESDLMQVAIREAMEETGLERVTPVSEALFSLETITVKSHIKRGKIVPAHLHMNLTWLLEADRFAPLKVKTDENSGVKWIPFESVEAAADEEEMLPIYRKLLAKTAAIKA